MRTVESREAGLLLRVELFTMDSGLITCVMGMVTKSLSMDLSTRGNGPETKQMVKENWFMQIKMYMMVNGLTIKLMEKEYTRMLMAPFIMVTGIMTRSMASARSRGMTERSTKASTRTETKMEKVN